MKNVVRRNTRKQVKAATENYWRMLPPRNDGKDGVWRDDNVIGKGKVNKV